MYNHESQKKKVKENEMKISWKTDKYILCLFIQN